MPRKKSTKPIKEEKAENEPPRAEVHIEPAILEQTETDAPPGSTLEPMDQIPTPVLSQDIQASPAAPAFAPQVNRSGTYAIPVAIVIAGAIVGASIFAGNIYTAKMGSKVAGTANQENNELQADDTLAEASKKISPLSETDHVRGSRTAKVIIFEYSDLDCPFCKQVHATFKQLIEKYGEDQVAWVYRHFPIPSLHPHAPLKAAASECVAALGGNEAFWKFADETFRTQNADSGEPHILSVAKTIGVDADALTACLDAGTYLEKVNAQDAEAVTVGARGTPHSIIISGSKIIPVVGAAPLQDFVDLIDPLLK